MTGAGTVERGREAFERQLWGIAHSELSKADREAPLAPEDIERLAMASHLLGLDADSAELWARAHREFLDADDAERAARCAFWLAVFGLLIHGDLARTAGWLARGNRILDDRGLDCVERGYLILPEALRCMFFQGDAASALAGFEQVGRIADRFRDRDLITLARLGLGQSLLRLGKTAEGVALLDEVMAAVTAGDVSHIVVGIAYCAVIEECGQIFDLRRAQEWTEALTLWCAEQPELVHYHRQCLVHRAEIMRVHGAWTEAFAEAQRACDLRSQVVDQLWTGAALYQQAELHRLRGDFAKAEESYRQASQRGRTPQPGLSLLRLAQGRVDAAAASIQREIEEARDPGMRTRLLSVHVEVLLASNNAPAARNAADELSAIAAGMDAPVLNALASQARGAVLLAEGDAAAALRHLRDAWAAWYELEAPYEAARVRVGIGMACRALGDLDGAELELDAARQVFQQLGAGPDIERVAALSNPGETVALAGLTERELEVLRLVAAGKTNHSIASELFISDHTVRRHLQNIFAKIGVPSRSAATAFAFQHDLI